MNMAIEVDSEVGLAGFDVRNEGRTFAVQRQNPATPPGLFKVVNNWFEELKEKVPVD